MRIGMFMPGLTPRSLGWQVHLDFADAVRGLGHHIELLTTAGPDAATDGAADTRVLTSSTLWETLPSPAAPLLRTRTLPRAAVALTTYLRRHGQSVDLLHVDMAYPPGAAASLAVVASGWDGPVVVTPVGEDTLIVNEAQYGFCRYPVPRVLVEWTLRRAACIPVYFPADPETNCPASAPDAVRRDSAEHLGSRGSGCGGASVGARRASARGSPIGCCQPGDERTADESWRLVGCTRSRVFRPSFAPCLRFLIICS